MTKSIKKIIPSVIMSMICIFPLTANAYISSSQLKDDEIYKKVQNGKMTYDEYYNYIIKENNNSNHYNVTLNDVDKDFQTGTLTFNKFCDYLNKNYNSIDTPIGKIYCSFDFMENEYTTMPYDYWLQTKCVSVKDSPYDFTSFSILDVTNSIKVTQVDKEATLQALKNYQYNIASMAIKYFSNKKIWGGYYSGWYQYPTLRVNWETERFNTWKNYDGSSLNNYYNCKLSNFQWDTVSDGYSE